MKRLLAMLLTVCMLVMLFPAMVFAEEPVAAEKVLYVDAVNGSDETGDGTEANPYKTVVAAIDANAADSYIIYLGSGEYTTYNGWNNDARSFSKLTVIGTAASGENKTAWKYGKDAAASGAASDGGGCADYSLQGVAVTFKNLSLEDNYNQPDCYFRGFIRCSSMSFENCVINNRMGYLGSGAVSFKACAFNTADYCIDLYSGTDFSFEACSFNSDAGKFINAYQPGTDAHSLTLQACSFNGRAEKYPAVKIKSADSPWTVTMTGCTTEGVKADSQTDSKLFADNGSAAVVTVDNTKVWEKGAAYVAPAATVNGVEYSSLAEAIEAAIGTENAVEIVADIDLTGKAWTPVEYSGGALTINGNNHTVKGMSDSLLNKTGSGGHVLAISNLTFDSCKDETALNDAAAIILPYADSMSSLTFTNVKISNSTVNAEANWSGAFIGYYAAYNAEDAVSFNNCTVSGCTLSGIGSTGGIIGHGNGNANGTVTVNNCTVTGNTITAAEGAANKYKAGSVIATVGAGSNPICVSATVIGNTVTSNGTEITTIYGRQGNTTGSLVVTGGSYDSRPIAEDAAWATVKEGYELIENDGVYIVLPVCPFDDVFFTDYYYIPVVSAARKGITYGVGNNLFAPNNVCTRAEIVTMLWRAKGSQEPTATSCVFTDVDADAYYYKAVLWAVENGITVGVGGGKFAPDAPCDRAQIVTFLWNAEKRPAATVTSCNFTDVSTNAYYYEAVLWAVENGITSGVGNNMFAPTNPCTRAEAVSFIYRAYP